MKSITTHNSIQLSFSVSFSQRAYSNDADKFSASHVYTTIVLFSSDSLSLSHKNDDIGLNDKLAIHMENHA